MPAKMEVYKCEVCGNIVELLHGGEGELVCCGEPMVLFSENTVDAAKEKHVPVAENRDGGCRVSVGSVAHPMEESHYIEWIELVKGSTVLRQHLEPGGAPEAAFCLPCDQGKARAYCNLHGLWSSTP
jgi:superoxide reductase